MIDLKPCPFCGSSKIDLIETRTVGPEVVCNECQNRTGTGETRIEVIDAWNRRVDPTPRNP